MPRHDVGIGYTFFGLALAGLSFAILSIVLGAAGFLTARAAACLAASFAVLFALATVCGTAELGHSVAILLRFQLAHLGNWCIRRDPNDLMRGLLVVAVLPLLLIGMSFVLVILDH
jgi:hypothetical protein